MQQTRRQAGNKILPIILVLVTGIGGLMIAGLYLSQHSQSGSGKWLVFPNSDLVINLETQQNGNRIQLILHDISYNQRTASWVEAEQALLSQLLAETRLSWQAVVMDGHRCDQNDFGPARRNYIQQGSFPSPAQRTLVSNNFIELQDRTQGYAYCIRVLGDDQSVYIKTAPIAGTGRLTDDPMNIVMDGAPVRPSFRVSQQERGDFHMVGLSLVSFNEPTEAKQYSVHIRSVETPEQCQGSKTAGWVSPKNDILPLPFEMKQIILQDYPQYRGKFICFQIGLFGNDWWQYYHRVSSRIANFEIIDLPASLTLDTALIIFKHQLTAAGLEALAGVTFATHEHGCDGPEYEITPWGGCYQSFGKRIYINEEYFPANYAELSRPQKIKLIKLAVDILAHEVFHAIDDSHRATADSPLNDDLESTIYRCYIGSPDSIESVTEDGFIHRRWLPNRWNKIGPATQECLHKHAFWGPVAKNIKRVYEQYAALSLPDIDKVWNKRADGENRIELFSFEWYVEVYAELPTYAIILPPDLEEHYRQYMQDRLEFAKALRGLRYYFKDSDQLSI